LLGSFAGIPYQSLLGIIKLAWVGFVVNLISGLALFASQASMFVRHPAFLIKIAAIFVAMILAAVIQNQLRQHAKSWDESRADVGAVSRLAAVSLALWLTAMIAGRLIAYILI
jgi:hypothetical protein